MKNILFLLLSSLLAFCCNNSKLKSEKESNLEVYSAFRLQVTGNELKGWGYQIYDGDKVFIDQPTIPAVGFNKKFITKSDAQKVGALMLKKLIHHNDELPSISIFELDSLKIEH